MKNNQLQKADDAGRIAAAMALIRQGQDNRPTRSPAPAAAEIVDAPQICAETGKPYLVSYVRGANGLFSFLRTIKLGPEPHNQTASRIKASAVTLRLDPASLPESCPWCGASSGTSRGKRFSAVRCGTCKTWVCTGRTVNGFFRCCDSCGQSGELGEHVEQTGTVRSPARTNNGLPAIAVKEPLRLSAGAPLPVKWK